MKQPSLLMQKLSSSIFSELAERKRQLVSKGVDVIDLSIGSPNLPPPQLVMKTIAEASTNPKNYGYTLTGIPAFHEAVRDFYKKRYQVEVDSETEVLQLMGSQDGLSHLATAIVNPGEYVLVPDPGYPIYEASVTIAGGQIYPLPLTEANGFLPVLADIPVQVLERTKMMILAYPGNPVTTLASRAFFEEVVLFAKKYDILVVHDFAYSELIFDEEEPVSFLSVEGAKDIGIEFNSLSKTFNMAGCRIGYVVGQADAIHKLKSLKSHMDYGVFLPIQLAAVAVLTSDFGYLQEQRREYVRRRNTLVDGLREAGWEVQSSPATMFLWSKIPHGWTSREFAFALLDHAGVAVVPGDAFGSQGEGYVRIALVQPAERLKEASARIGLFLSKSKVEEESLQ